MRTPVALLTLLLITGLTGCTLNSELEVNPSPSQEEEESVQLASFCAKFTAGEDRYATFIEAATTDQVSLQEFRKQLAHLEELEGLATMEEAVLLAEYGEPVYQIQDVVEDGGGAIDIATEGYHEAASDLIQTCATE